MGAHEILQVLPDYWAPLKSQQDAPAWMHCKDLGCLSLTQLTPIRLTPQGLHSGQSSLLSGFQRAIPFEFSLLQKLLHISLFVCIYWFLFMSQSSELNPRTSPLSVLILSVRPCSFLLHMTSQTDIAHIPKLPSLPHKLPTHTSSHLKHFMGISDVTWPKPHF